MDKTKVFGIIESVRNTLLHWTIRLEQDGILGEGLTFSEAEKTAAGRGDYNINYFFGNVSGSQIQQGSSGIIHLQLNSAELQELSNLLNDLGAALQQIKLDGESRVELESEIETLTAQLKSPKPKKGVVRQTLASIRNILLGATGQVLAERLLSKIGDLLTGL